MSEYLENWQRDLLREKIKHWRREAEPVGPLHALWDSISDAESMLNGRSTLLHGTPQEVFYRLVGGTMTEIVQPIGITLKQAYEMWSDRSNGADEGRSSSKGGRAWLSGEFQLCELEALCVILRCEAGEYAEGAVELLRNAGDPGYGQPPETDVLTAWAVLDMDGGAFHSVHIFREDADKAAFGLGTVVPLQYYTPGDSAKLRAACQVVSMNWTLSGEQVFRLYQQVNETIAAHFAPQSRSE